MPFQPCIRAGAEHTGISLVIQAQTAALSFKGAEFVIVIWQQGLKCDSATCARDLQEKTALPHKISSRLEASYIPSRAWQWRILYINIIRWIELSFLVNFLDQFYALCKEWWTAILTFAEFVSLCTGQPRNQLQKIICCILYYSLHTMAITGI